MLRSRKENRFANTSFGQRADENLRGRQNLRRSEAKGDDSEVLELVELVRAGDQRAFQKLVEIYQQRVYAIAYSVIGNAHDAEDIAQEAFVKVFKKISSFRGQSSFYTWLYRIVFNLSVDLSRKRYRQRELTFGDQTGLEAGLAAQAAKPGADRAHPMAAGPESLNPEQVLYRAQIQEKIRVAMEELSPEHRAVITLREIEGLSYEEISEVVGVSKGTVMSRLHHARRRLQRSLASFLGRQSDGHSEEGNSFGTLAK